MWEYVKENRFWLLIAGAIMLLSLIFIYPLADVLFSELPGAYGKVITDITMPIGVGIVAMVGLSFTWERTKALTEQAKEMKRSIDQMEKQNITNQQLIQIENEKFNVQREQEKKRLIEKRFNHAIQHLGCENFNIALSGVYELHNIALESKQFRKLIFDIFCASVRSWSNRNNRSCGSIDKEWGKLGHFEKEDQRPLMVVQKIMDTLFIKSEGIYDGLIADFKYADLRGIKLSKIKIKNVDFTKAAIHYADMYDSEFINCEFYKACLEGANMSNSKFIDCNFSLANLCWANLYGADLTKANFSYADMTAVVLSGNILSGTNFYQTCLDGAELHKLKFVEPFSFEDTTFVFASLFDKNIAKYFKGRIEITGAQNNTEYYEGHSRINRITIYGTDKKLFDSTAVFFNQQGAKLYDEKNYEIKVKKYNNIVNKIKKYALHNNTAEDKFDSEYEVLQPII